MSRYSPFHLNSEITLKAAAIWRDRCLTMEGSLFGAEHLWSVETLSEVADRFSGAVEGGVGGFYDKLTEQFDGASPSACKLLSEMLWILYLFDIKMGPVSKRNGIRRVWAWSGAPLTGEQADQLLSDDVLKGLGSGGPGFMNHRPRELGFLIRAMMSFKSLQSDKQMSLLNDSWTFATWLDEVPDEGRRQLKLILPHLLFPETFERFSSAGQVRQVVNAFGNLPRKTIRQMSKIELDRELARVREELEKSRGGPIDFYQADIKTVWDPSEEVEDAPSSTSVLGAVADGTPSATVPLNQILYGPPGTGKTFQVVDRALAILDPEFLVRSEGDREGLKERFDELVDEGLIRFVTFHQSFSYEEFIEGLRAETTEEGSVRYVVRDGVLKSFCTHSQPFKVGEQFSSAYVVSRCTQEILWLDKPNGSQLPFPWKVLDELAGMVRRGQITVQDIRDKKVFDLVPDCRLEKFLVNGYNNIISVIVERLLERSPQSRNEIHQKRVLIIDEINRGNISKILGETITLIEPSKRLGTKEALTTILPYSKSRFGVPVGIHIIGTMNTADRSLASIDMALRRRFVFEEIEPQTTQLEGVEIAGVDLAQLLSVMNARIEALLDRDHRLGHAYFLNLQASDKIDQLKELFSRRIVPLLKEYFFDDWRRIRLVLNDQRKNDPDDRFIIEGPHDAAALFGTENPGVATNGTWRINTAAFDRPTAYRQIIGEHNADS
ncbi:McrB family protein [Sinorhizobium meliloti]|uniref:McrB family protein n=1 Tax=Rhizobium meliloti TaxID=382 RepID=UPI000FDB2889|nr:AAA family ATPase [Sinorhizobium meliloti]RVI50180.1 restriction endonuclease [Sinorhizobium meliloti]